VWRDEVSGKWRLLHPLKWKNTGLSAALDRPVRLEVKFRNARIYSLSLSHHFLDAQDQWLLKDGKKIDPNRFDF